MKIQIVTPNWPPQVCGIGDYSARLAQALAARAGISVHVVTAAGGDPAGTGIMVETAAFDPARPNSVAALESLAAREKPDWLLLQYQPFAYGRWGLNLHLPRVVRQIRRVRPDTRFALMIHEPFVPVHGPKDAVMTSWQRYQLWALGRSAQIVFCSIDPWARRFARWFPGCPVQHLPAGSNVSFVPIPRASARRALDLPESDGVLGFFGTAHPSRLLDWIGPAAQHAHERTGKKITVLYVGPHGEQMRQAIGKRVVREGSGVAFRDAGMRHGADLSCHFAAMDVYLAPFADGISTRRTSLMTGLQHGTALVGTCGPLTDAVLQREQGHAFLLSDVGAAAAAPFGENVAALLSDANERARLGAGARDLFCREFTWERIAARLLAALGS